MGSLQTYPVVASAPLKGLQALRSNGDVVTFDSVSAVKALSSYTTSFTDSKLGSCLHAKILKSGLHSNTFVSNALLDMYIKTGKVQDAQKLFDGMPERTVVSWTSLISGYSRCGLPHEAILSFSKMGDSQEHPNEFTLASLLQACSQIGDARLALVIHGYILKCGLGSDGFLQNSLVGAYAKSGMLEASIQLLNRFGLTSIVAWTSVISGYVLNGMAEEAISCFLKMLQGGVDPNEVTLLSISHACSLLKDVRLFQWVQTLALKHGFCANHMVLNSLVEMYLVNGCLYEGAKLFCDFGFSGNGRYLTPETMATLLQGCGVKLGEQLNGYLMKNGFFPCTVVENSLIDMYGENGESESAFQIFSRMKNRDTVSWNSMATCFINNTEFHEVLQLLKAMHKDEKGDSVSPDFVTMLAWIQACSNVASLHLGEVVHGYITRTGMICDTFVQNALIDMYGKTGRLDLAEMVFDGMHEKDTGSYNSMIGAYGHNGNSIRALRLFSELKKSETCKLNAITFTNILSACSHAGMIREGFQIFNFMQREYKAEQRMEHFACMVDLLGKSARLEEAEAFIQEMQVKPSKDVWGALLGACGCFGNVEIAEKAAKELSALDPEANLWRVTLSNVYASAGRWEDVCRVRAEMRGLDGLQKESGWSSVELYGESFRFMVNDTKHPKSEEIYWALGTMMDHASGDREPQVFPYNSSIRTASRETIMIASAM